MTSNNSGIHQPKWELKIKGIIYNNNSGYGRYCRLKM
jgi:hypothetical protein